ncbi:two-component system sensor histidine kinase NtrB [Paenibacillus camelliae]|uniref:two-component system sensor histidine kinase NtrB n=1 Tax=Paenibacillus camelliae TaxID=512410 RepID=UPI0020401BEE|nr:ATP-binding protein [Paenibacillus camelliae]MCM3633322.1 ATP-binding protein [Paenibacillus camelliae]
MNDVLLTPDMLPFPYFMVDRELNILLQTDCVKHKFPIAHNFLELVDASSREKIIDDFTKLDSIHKLELHLHTRKKKAALFEIYIHCQSSNQIHLFCIDKESQMESFQTQVSGLECNFINVTHSLLEEKIMLEQSIEQLQQSVIEHENLATVGKLAASIAHEIRNPLTSVRGFVQLLRPHLLEIGKEHYADVAISELDRANDIIYEFLNTSKPSAPTLEQVSIVSVVEEVMLLCQSESLLNNCYFEYRRPDNDIWLCIDPKQIKQVLLNLIHNAMDAVKESVNRNHGVIMIDIRHLHSRVEIVIADNGSGINQENMQKIFAPFYTTKKKGTGVGLAVCQRIIEDHNGKIDVHSQLGRGTSFTITLPCLTSIN